MRISTLATAAVAVLLGASPSFADDIVVSGSFASDHCTGGCGTAPFATITVTDHQNGVLDFVIDPLGGNTIINTGFDLSFAFNLIGDPTITYTNLTAGFSVGSTGNNPVQPVSAFTQMDGFGTFEYGVRWNISGGGNGTAGNLAFTITGPATLDWTDLLEKSDANQPINQAYMALDIRSGTTGNTGLVDLSITPTVQQVPAPLAGAGLPGLIAACGGLLVLVRRRRQKIA